MDANITPLTPQNAVTARSADAMNRTTMSRLALMPTRAKVMLGVGAAALVALAASLLLWSQSANLAPLYPNGMSDKDAAPVLDQLRQLGVAPKVMDGGVVMVPAAQVAELRMKLSQAGLPKSSPSGFALMDNARFGQSQLQERTQLQRALQDEVGKSIAQLASVDSARVILALPTQNGFYREQQKPSASVVVTLRPGHTLDRQQIAGIVHLVSSSVADLSPKAVTVLDQNGTPLAGTGDSAQQGLDSQQLQYVQQVENSYLKRVLEILEPALGRDNLRATVTAEIDFTQQESTSEAYKPNQTGEATLRSQRSAESTVPGTAQPSGVPGAASNQPPTPAAAPLTGASAPLQGSQVGLAGGGARKESTINYEVDKTVSVKRNATGVVKRLNAAVLVNHRSTTDAKGKTTTAPLPPEEMEKLTALVQETIGFSKDRGDSVKVVSIPFRADAVPKTEDLPLWKQPWLLDLVRAGAVPLALMGVALLLVFAVIRPALKQGELPETDAEAEAAAKGLDAVVDDTQALPGPDGAEMAALEPPKVNKKLEDARMLARENPSAVASIVRGWVSGEAA
ncbi:flagellar basal-body MS-ring/collar protein FliF [Ideonella sp. A 288]|uniref:flagellar basal-body MS-ring/collar protein FliF n=1 Tax=Ideonella sp. A 288 TaxID=1962181 RepID=UPI000B4BEDF1|nr:flagellar basal-body MS-ring/collar protein FliF [Ideonella sp. A 288]